MMYCNSEKVFSKLEKFIIILSRNNYSSKNSIEITFPFNIICYVIMCYVSMKKNRSFFIIKVFIHTKAQTDALLQVFFPWGGGFLNFIVHKKSPPDAL